MSPPPSPAMFSPTAFHPGLVRAEGNGAELVCWWGCRSEQFPPLLVSWHQILVETLCLLLHLSPCSLVDSNIWSLPVAPELADLEGTEEEDPELLMDNQSWLDGGSEHKVEKDAQPGPKRRARQLTEEDLPVNDYVSAGNHTLGCPDHGPRVSWSYSWGIPAIFLG